MSRKLILTAIIFLSFTGSYIAKTSFIEPKLSSNYPENKVDENNFASCKRIVSLAPSITETLFALGLGDNVVGVTRYCKYPLETAKIKKVGGYSDTNYEAVITLQPDITVLLQEHGSAGKHLNELGLRTLPVNHKNISGILESIKTIGKACGAEKKADEILEQINEKVSFVTNKTKKLPRPKVMVTVGRNMGSGSLKDIFISGKDGFFDQMIKLAGGINAYVGDTVVFPSVSGEGIMALNPQVIIDMIPDFNEKGWDEEKALDIWQNLPGVEAVKNRRVHIFGQDYVAIPGPRFILILEQMARVIHPEVQWE